MATEGAAASRTPLNCQDGLRPRSAASRSPDLGPYRTSEHGRTTFQPGGLICRTAFAWGRALQ